MFFRSYNSSDMKVTPQNIFLLLLLEVALVENVVLARKTLHAKRSKVNTGDEIAVQQYIENAGEAEQIWQQLWEESRVTASNLVPLHPNDTKIGR
eukprot:g38653.t1